MHLLSAARAENGGRIRLVCDRLDRLTAGLAGRRIAQLGLSFKPHTDDLRHSPALALARGLIERGANVVAHDSAVPFSRTAEIEHLTRVGTPAEAMLGADVVVLATEWPEYLTLDWAGMRRIVGRGIVFDGRNALDERRLRGLGWIVARIGRAMANEDAGHLANERELTNLVRAG
jgi:UDPglucose 6-dehydrogenase